VIGDELPEDGQDEHNRMLGHRYRIGAAVGTNGNARGPGTGNIHPVIAGAEHLDELQVRRVLKGLIRYKAEKAHQIVRIFKRRGDILNTGCRRELLEGKPRWLHLQRQCLNVGWHFNALGKYDLLFGHRALLSRYLSSRQGWHRPTASPSSRRCWQPGRVVAGIRTVFI
jgi:hypothetical protein